MKTKTEKKMFPKFAVLRADDFCDLATWKSLLDHLGIVTSSLLPNDVKLTISKIEYM
jgi:hypothetical protein